jgi:hypothetical protein
MPLLKTASDIAENREDNHPVKNSQEQKDFYLNFFSNPNFTLNCLSSPRYALLQTISVYIIIRIGQLFFVIFCNNFSKISDYLPEISKNSALICVSQRDL